MKCLSCKRTILVHQTVEVDKKTKKRWVVSYCASCNAPFDLEEYDETLHHYLKYEWKRNKKGDT